MRRSYRCVEDKKEKGLKSVLKKIKTEYLILAAVFIVAIIILIGAITPAKTQTASSASAVDDYVVTLEKKLKNCLSEVKGAGKVDVIISVASSMQTVFATETTVTNSVKKETTVTVGGKPVVLKETYPEISGVLIVAEGADNIAVKVDLLNACEVFLSVTEDKIKILSMKK